ncbi:MAG: asparagine synthase (glutamine-hydrolyzing) [bacterium]
MCGICGIYNTNGINDADLDAIPVMTAALRHRGPDDSGIYSDERAALGHTRLSIVDIEGGAQPMANEEGAVWTVFNGEIYNFAELRSALEGRGHIFRTHCDTEVIVHAYEDYGDSFVERLEGMFAIALWDKVRGRLMLARDRAGKKPLYYVHIGGRLIFASEIKSILLHPAVERRLNAAALHHLISFQHVPGEETIFTGIKKLRAAHAMSIEKGIFGTPERYWQPTSAPQRTKPDAARSATDEIINILLNSVRERLIGDVPIGAFLSGGIDSSTVVALLSECAKGRIQTFSIGFAESVYDETPYAREVARRFNTHHTEFTVTPRELLECAPRLVWHCDEPFADSSILPTYLLSKLTRGHVKVAISGDGGDELFGGYERYIADKYLHWFNAVVPSSARHRVIAPILNSSKETMPQGKLKHRLAQLAQLAPLSDQARHLSWFSFMTHDEKIALYAADFADALLDSRSEQVMETIYRDIHGAGADFTQRQLMVDFLNYLPETLMMKVDRASMANALEVRCPLLSKRMVEFAFSISGGMKIRGGRTKWILKRAASRLLPGEIIHRRKHGFEVPLDDWFRGALREQAHDLLTCATFINRGLFNPSSVDRLLSEHTSGARNHGHKLWLLLNLEMWFRTFMDGTPPTEPRSIL